MLAGRGKQSGQRQHPVRRTERLHFTSQRAFFDTEDVNCPVRLQPPGHRNDVNQNPLCSAESPGDAQKQQSHS